MIRQKRNHLDQFGTRQKPRGRGQCNGQVAPSSAAVGAIRRTLRSGTSLATGATRNIRCPPRLPRTSMSGVTSVTCSSMSDEADCASISGSARMAARLSFSMPKPGSILSMRSRKSFVSQAISRTGFAVPALSA